MSNKQKQYGFLAATVVVMVGLALIDIDLYKEVLFLIGAWQIGSWAGNYARARWPK